MADQKITSVNPMSASFATEGMLRIDKIASGIGIILFHAKTKKAAGLHVLRDYAPTANPSVPAYYADTGIAQILESFQLQKAHNTLSVAISGGAALLSKSKYRVPQRLAQAVKTIIIKKGLSIKVEKLGGSQIRSMVLDIDAGKLKIT